MSRLAQRNGASAPVRASEEDDICPVCKSSRYLNPNMRFLVNPECYHKMCESCVDRIFSHGPAQCPVAGCRKTLRKHRFRKQTFDDIQVEREVDIRRRVAEVFNRREDEFETLLDYNNYLEEVENITFNLVNKIDIAENEKKLNAYREENARSIQQNATRALGENALLQARQAAEREQARFRREAARQEEEEDRRAKEEGKRDIIDKLATGQGNAKQIAEEGAKVILKRASARRANADQQQERNSARLNGAANGAFTITGLKKIVAAEPEKPYDPFGGVTLHRTYHVLQDRYEWDWLNAARTSVQYTAGGYDIQEYCQRALLDAFSGLGVFVQEEMAGKTAEAAVPATPAAAIPLVGGRPKSTDTNMVDVF